MIYFDQAATSFQKPQEVISAVQRAFFECASVGRSGHSLSMRSGEIAYQTRLAASELFDTEPDRVVFTFNATHGLNIAIRSLVTEGDTVVISGFEHNAVLRPLREIGAKIIVAGTTLFDQKKIVSEFQNSINSNVKAVICTHVSNVFGYILPIDEIAQMCQSFRVPFILDASQSAGVLPISMEKLRASYIAMPGHKGLYGPQGTGILLCGDIPKPLICGGTGANSMSDRMPEFLPDAAEAGTHNIHGISGLYEGLRFIKQVGTEKILKHEKDLLSHLLTGISQNRDFEYYRGNEMVQTGVLSMNHKSLDCEELAEMLNNRQIAVRAGLHCAPIAHYTAGTIHRGTVRISFSYFNTYEEVDYFLDQLGDVSRRRKTS